MDTVVQEQQSLPGITCASSLQALCKQTIWNPAKCRKPWCDTFLLHTQPMTMLLSFILPMHA